ncbi:MAG TPA: TonB-dependent receptor [Steroidobacteraceae bacterium]|nr:TonB-dependent receptor [Steroidobacteraceae bacterium]
MPEDPDPTNAPAPARARAYAARAPALPIALALMLCAWVCPAPADTDTAALDQLKGLSIEQLMNIPVTTVARHPQKLIDTASAVQIITQEDIRRSGATTLAQVLRLADNLQVAQKNSHDWAISARGFNTALANKLLVMIDGRTVYTPLFSGVFWDLQDYPLEDIDHIEVISGPGGTLWGANAVNGVINIITRSSKDTQGAYAEAGGGSQLNAIASARYGGTLSANTTFRVYGKYIDSGDDVLTDGAPAFDAWRDGRGGFRMDSQPSTRDTMTLQGDAYQSHEDEPAGGVEQAGGENVLGRWTRQFSADADMSLQAYVDRTQLLDPVPAQFLGPIPLAPAGYLEDNLTTYDVDFQHRFPVGTYTRLVWGLGFRHTHDDGANAPGLAFLPAILNQNLYSSFIQDEIPLSPTLSLIAGTKLEHNDYTGWELQPDARLRWIMTDQQTLWAAVSRAVRTPSRVDRDEVVPPGVPPHLVLLEGDSDFDSEKVIAYELGYRAQLFSRVGGSVSTFYNVYSDLRSTSYTPGFLLPFYFSNNLEGHTYGLEFSADYRLLSNWSLHAGYTLLREDLWVKPGQFDLNDALNETADPKNQFSVRSNVDLPRNLHLDADLRYVDSLVTNSGPTPGIVPGYYELNGRLAWQASEHLELSIVGQNLLHDEHTEYGFPGPTRVEIQRSVYAKVAWRH